MAATELPLCPSCLTRVLAWTATRCSACKETAPISNCDRCTETIWVVAIVLFGVYWWKWMPAWATLAAFALALVAFVRWILAARRAGPGGQFTTIQTLPSTAGSGKPFTEKSPIAWPAEPLSTAASGAGTLDMAS